VAPFRGLRGSFQVLGISRGPLGGGRKLIACGGLEKNIVKCVATGPLFRGENLSLILVNEVLHIAFEVWDRAGWGGCVAQSSRRCSPPASWLGACGGTNLRRGRTDILRWPPPK
jgi:hypothetical protein